MKEDDVTIWDAEKGELKKSRRRNVQGKDSRDVNERN